MSVLSLPAGTKLYSYCYGPMTITRSNDRFAFARMDDPGGAADLIQKSNRLTPEHCFYLASIGHWVFLDEKDIGHEDDVFEHNCQPPLHMQVNPKLAHKVFRTKFPDVPDVLEQQTMEDSESTDTSSSGRTANRLTLEGGYSEKKASRKPSKLTLESDSATKEAALQPNKLTLENVSSSDKTDANGKPNKLILEEDSPEKEITRNPNKLELEGDFIDNDTSGGKPNKLALE